MSNHWTMKFWSSPSLCLIDAMFAGVAIRPAMRCAGIAARDLDEDQVDQKLTAIRTRIIPNVRRMRNATI